MPRHNFWGHILHNTSTLGNPWVRSQRLFKAFLKASKEKKHFNPLAQMRKWTILVIICAIVQMQVDHSTNTAIFKGGPASQGNIGEGAPQFWGFNFFSSKEPGIGSCWLVLKWPFCVIVQVGHVRKWTLLFATMCLSQRLNTNGWCGSPAMDLGWFSTHNFHSSLTVRF